VFAVSGNQLTISPSAGNWNSHFKTWKVFVHGATRSSIQVDSNAVETAVTDYRFVQPVSDFDPYHKPPSEPVQVKELSFITIEATPAEVVISW